jgi:Clp amino terminal domain, pathogenicity island component
MRILWMVAALLVSASAISQDQSAVLGNSSRGGNQDPRNPGYAASINRAMQLAKESGRKAPTVEQLLLALLDDDSVQEALASQHVDVDSVRGSLLQYLASQLAGDEPADSGGADPRTINATRRAATKATVANRDPLPTDLVVAILAEGDSFAARTLADHGLTTQEAEDASLNHYLEIQKENDRRFGDMQRRIEEAERAPAHQGPIMERAAGVSTSFEPQDYVLRITARGPTPLRFKGAVSHDGALDLYVESTPFEVRFKARRVAALFQAIDRGWLEAELVTEIDGAARRVGGFSGTSGAIFQDVSGGNGQRSGTLR